jgi:propionyl-CoA synthetase
MSYNALDRQIEEGRGDQVAIAYHSCVGGRSREITYSELQEDVSRFAGSLRNLGVEKGDR